MKHDERLDQLRADLQGAGFAEGYEDDGLGAPAAEVDTITVPTLPPDQRPDAIVCQLCIRSVNVRRRVWIRPGVAACKVCAGEPNDPAEVDAWIRIPRGDRRLHLAMSFGVDPASGGSVNPGTVSTTHLFEDVDGTPLAAVTHSAAWSMLHARGYFDLAAERTLD